MKKVCIAILAVLLCLSFVACNLSAPSDKAAEPFVNTVRCVELLNTDDYNNTTYNGTYDFDFDGVAETIDISITESANDWDESLNIHVGNYSTSLQAYGANLAAVYAFDIDATDNLMDLCIVTVEYSGDPVWRILRYEPGLPPYNFTPDEYYGGPLETFPSAGLGYAISFYFDIDAEGVITAETQTPSVGMWSVHSKYKVDENGAIAIIPQEKYEILQDYFAPSPYENITDAEELRMWHNGYIKAYTDYANSEISITTGDYFKPIYDDGNNRLYVEKSTGESGWIYIEDPAFNRYVMNPRFFNVAG